jgi:hypothetical protein
LSPMDKTVGWRSLRAEVNQQIIVQTEGGEER